MDKTKQAKKMRRLALEGKELDPIEAKLNGTERTFDLMSDLYVSNDLDSEFDRQPSLFAWYGVLAEDALATAKQVKNQLQSATEDVRYQIAKSGKKLSIDRKSVV